MRYRKLIQDFFLIDDAKTGELIPFILNPVQNKYYDDLCRDYDIENKGVTAAIRENIVKARREGFSSLILGIFAADDIMQENPTETSVISYKDDATATFRKRYRNFILSFFARRKMLHTVEEIRNKPAILDKAAKRFLTIDGTDIELAHNRAHFSCGTASARVGGRGGVLQKLLFSEIAYYPNTEKMTAKEVVEGTMRQIDINSGWIFGESTENGRGTYQYQMWSLAKKGLSRFRNRFYGAKEFYSEEEIDLIKSEYVDMDMFRRDYPMTEDDLFKSSQLAFTTEEDLFALVNSKDAKKDLAYWLEIQGTNYIDQCEIITNSLEMLIREHPKHALYVGLDTAKQVDRTVLTVLKDRRTSLTGGIKIITIDSTGHGDFIPDWFERNTSWYVERVKFSRPTKHIIYTNLTVVIKQQQTSLPILIEDKEYTSEEAKNFTEEMLALEKKTIGNLIVVAHPDGGQFHDDHPDSWALAEHGYIVINGVDKREKPTASLSLPNMVENMLNKKNTNKRVVDDEYA